MNRYPMEPTGNLSKMTPEEQAEVAAFRNQQTQELFVAGTSMLRSLIDGAVYTKGKGRGSLQKTAAACLMIDREELGLGVADYKVDSRPVVIAATKGRIVRHRPKIENWSVTFILEYDGDMLSDINVREIVDNAGLRCGVGDFRPTRKGPFGRYRVDKWAELDIV